MRTGECMCRRTIVIGDVLVFFFPLQTRHKTFCFLPPQHYRLSAFYFIFFPYDQRLSNGFHDGGPNFHIDPLIHLQSACNSFVYTQKVLFSSLLRHGYRSYVWMGEGANLLTRKKTKTTTATTHHFL